MNDRIVTTSVGLVVMMIVVSNEVVTKVVKGAKPARP
jgi:hypothetical protein